VWGGAAHCRAGDLAWRRGCDGLPGRPRSWAGQRRGALPGCGVAPSRGADGGGGGPGATRSVARARLRLLAGRARDRGGESPRPWCQRGRDRGGAVRPGWGHSRGDGGLRGSTPAAASVGCWCGDRAEGRGDRLEAIPGLTPRDGDSVAATRWRPGPADAGIDKIYLTEVDLASRDGYVERLRRAAIGGTAATGGRPAAPAVGGRWVQDRAGRPAVAFHEPHRQGRAGASPARSLLDAGPRCHLRAAGGGGVRRQRAPVSMGAERAAPGWPAGDGGLGVPLRVQRDLGQAPQRST
jgi:hypothetical protein